MTINDDNRCTMLMLGVVGESLKALQTAYIRNQMRHVHLMDYYELVNDPENTMGGLYNFLGIDYFEHDFNKIKHQFREHDDIYGLPEMHSVRSTLSFSDNIINKYQNLSFWKGDSSNYADVLSKNIIKKYQNLSFWKGEQNVLSSPSLHAVG